MADREDLKLVKLLSSYDRNYEKVEKHALQTIHSLEVAMFNVLSDITPHNLLTALRRMEVWFGKVRSMEHCMCLIMLTDYISCAYNQRMLYKTFDNALTEKYVDSLFQKLHDEWAKVFNFKEPINFSMSELESIKRSLLASINRYSESFRHRSLMDRIVNQCENYAEFLSQMNLQNINNNNLPKACDVPARESQKLNFRSDSSITSMKKRSLPNMNQYVVHKKRVNERISNEEVISESLPFNNATREIHFIEESKPIIVKKEVNESTVSIISINNVPSPLKTISNTGVTTMPNFCINEIRNNKISTDICVVPPPKKLNAFDIMMRRASLPNRKRIC